LTAPEIRGPSVKGPGLDDPAPDVSLLDMAAREATLSDYWQREPAVVVFLRYFGCPFCQSQVVGLKKDRERFEDAGAGIVLIGQGTPSDAVAFTRRMDHPFECLVDPDRAAYRAYGLPKARPAQVVGPRAALPFLRANLHRQTVQRGLQGGKFMQMPGTFVVDTEGLVRMAHRNRHVADTPPNQRILDVLARLRERHRAS
jgi:prostamide/prostaglandin F2alpha synthase